MPDDAHAGQEGSLRGGTRLRLAALCAVVALGAAALTGLAWTRSATAPTVLNYQQRGALSYTAPTSATSVYGVAGLLTGQPIYISQVPTVQVSYAYRFIAPAHTVLTGTEQLMATVTDGDGLGRSLPLQPPTPFHGGRFSTTATLRLATLQAISAAFNAATGNNVGNYAVAIAPHISVQGHVGSTAVKTSFDPATKFILSASMLTVTSSPASSAAGIGGATIHGAGAPITSRLTGSLEQTSVRGVLLLGGLTVSAARVISLAVLGAALCAGLLLGWPLLKEVTSDNERMRIATKYGTSFVDVTSLPTTPQAMVDLASFEGLLRISRQIECPLLHLQSDLGDAYAVVDNGTVYRYHIARSVSLLGPVPSATSDSPRHAAAAQ